MTPNSYSHIGRKEHSVEASWWEEQYQKGEAFWDHGEPSPGLVDFLAEEKHKPGTVLVPGCGRGHDCRAFARNGFAVTGLDISPRATEEAKKLMEGHPAAAGSWPKVRYVVGDFLEFAHQRSRRSATLQRLPEFDWLFEHTCFSAIDPDLREQYVRSVTAALKPGGHYLGVFYNIQPESGPPFGTTREELLDRFSPHFELLLEKVPRSYPNREGKELLMLWKKR